MTDVNRQYHFDNIKCILILLVVTGHFVDRCINMSYTYKALFCFIYTFHMPAFLFISGLFSKRTLNKEQFPSLKIYELFCLYILAKLTIWLTKVLYYQSYKFSLFVEPELPWFFVALGFCYVVTWCIKRYNLRSFLCLSILLGCLCGYDNNIGDFLVLSRSIILFPFFLCGYMLDPETATKSLSGNRCKILAVFLAAAAFYIIYRNAELLYQYRSFFKGNGSFMDMGIVLSYGWIFRILWYAFAAAMIAVTISLVPSGKTVLTRFGQRTRSIMIFHIPVKEFFFRFGVHAFLVKSFPGIGWKLIYIVLSVITTFALGTRFFERFIENYLKRLSK